MAEQSRLRWSTYLQAPEPILRGLRDVDASAELVHVRGPRWWLGCIRHNSDAKGKAERMLERALRTINWKVWQLTQERGGRVPRVRLDARTADRLNLALLALQGFRVIAEYTCPAGPQWDMVEDFRAMDWLWKNVRDDALFAVLDDVHEAPLREARKELRDEQRASMAWRYLFTQSHLVRQTQAPRSSARRLVKTI